MKRLLINKIFYHKLPTCHKVNKGTVCNKLINELNNNKI